LTTKATAASPAGSYPITASGAASPNYTISYASNKGTLTVSPAALTISAVSTNKAYGAAVPALTASYSGFVNGDTASSLTKLPVLSTEATAASPVGSYPITASGAASPNYTINYARGTLTVNAATLTISAVSTNKLYGAAVPALTASYSGFVNGDTASSLTQPPVLTTTATAASPMGSYPITASGAASPNYAISYVSGTLTVEMAAPPVFRAVTQADGTITLTWSATAGQNYQVQYSTDLSQPDWTDLVIVTATNSTATVSDALNSAAQRFYRTLWLP